MKCFKCRKDFDDVEKFYTHIQITHKIKGQMKCTCTLCFAVYGSFTKYKRHIKVCSKNGLVTDMAQYDAIIGYNINDKYEEFNESLTNNALLLTSKMCAKANLPRSTTFDLIKDIVLFIKTAADGMKSAMIAEINDKQKLFEDLVLALESSFDSIDSEWKLVKLLKRSELIDSLQGIDVKLNKRIDDEKFAFEDIAEEGGSDIDDDVDEGGDEEMRNATDEPIEKPKCTLVVMPIAHQIKQFFELPNVFAKIQAHTAAIEAQPTLNHFIKGSVWKEKIKNYRDGEIVIPYNFYVDGVQLNNLLGPHTELGLENFNYISFPNIPTEYQSQLSNIMVVSLFQEKTIKENGTKNVYKHIIKDLTNLAYDGIILNIDNQQIKVYFVMGSFEGDNKECNRSLEFPNSHSANCYCRFCRMNKHQMRTATEEDIALRRTVDNYNEDVITNQMSRTGVKTWSIFNTVPYFHVVLGTVNDLPHDLLEGVLAYCCKSVLRYFVVDKEYFTVDELNKRIKSFNYGFVDSGNKPPRISEKNLKNQKKKKIKMNAAEMFNFCQNITFIIGELIPEEEEDHWQFVKNIVKLLDTGYLPWFEPEELVLLRSVIKLVNEQYQELFEELKPVFHYLTHYPTNIERFGPMRYVQTIRKEAKHKELKMYTKNSNNRLNISVSVARKVQYQNALRALTSKGFEDTLTTNKVYICSIKDKSYYRNVKASNHRNTISAGECRVTTKAVINGMAFRTGLWMPDFTDKQKAKIYEIGDIVVMDPDNISSIYGICKVYEKISYEDRFVAHSVELGSVLSHLEVVNFKEYLVQHQYPVVTHSIDNKVLFRCKRF